LVRASACHAEGRRFEPGHSRHSPGTAIQKSVICFSIYAVDLSDELSGFLAVFALSALDFSPPSNLHALQKSLKRIDAVFDGAAKRQPYRHLRK
jgi:hypothetical protein